MRFLPFLLFALLSLSAPAAEPIRLACLGDSLTRGAKVDVATESYPAQLLVLLGDKFVVKNLGAGGATMWHGGKPNAFQQLEPAAAFAPQIVIVAFGTNDTRSRDASYWSHFGEMEAETTRLLDTLLAATPKPRIILCHPAAIQETMPGMTDEVRANRAERVPRLGEIRALLTKITERYAPQGVHLADLYTPTAKRPELYDADGVHLKAPGYKLLAETLQPHVLAAAEKLEP